MPRSRPAANPVSYHKPTKQYYVIGARKRVYLGSDRDEALKKYHRLSLGLELPTEPPKLPAKISVVELANRFMQRKHTVNRRTQPDPYGPPIRIGA